MIREFVETKLFQDSLDQVKDEQLEKIIKDDLLENPARGAVIPGTGGVRKFRVIDKYRNKGKRGGFRVLYLDLPLFAVTYLILLYSKDVKIKLTLAQKKTLKALVEQIKQRLNDENKEK